MAVVARDGGIRILFVLWVLPLWTHLAQRIKVLLGITCWRKTGHGPGAAAEKQVREDHSPC